MRSGLLGAAVGDGLGEELGWSCLAMKKPQP